jgi:hypothetical protein
LPDWVVHIAVAWTLCRLLRFKYPQFNTGNTAIAMVGSILPDAVKIGSLVPLFGLANWMGYFNAIHTPLTSLVLAGLVSLLFKGKKTAFLFLSFGILTHYFLDLLLIGEGIYLFYPISWISFHLDLVPNDDYNITIIALIIALTVYLLSKWYERHMKTVET